MLRSRATSTRSRSPSAIPDLASPDEKLARLFVALTAWAPSAGDVEGTGLGLTLSKSLVEQMGGTVHAHSTVGEGSVFTVQLKDRAQSGR